MPHGTHILCVGWMYDLETGCLTVTYIDYTTLYHVTSDTRNTSVQEAINMVVANWSECNDMWLNAPLTYIQPTHF